jgi:hypothetical protein
MAHHTWSTNIPWQYTRKNKVENFILLQRERERLFNTTNKRRFLWHA